MKQGKSQEDRILWLLHASYPSWTPAPALAEISLQYCARLYSLRRQGWQIANRIEIVHGKRHGSYRLAQPLTFTNPLPKVPTDKTPVSLFGDLTPPVRHRDDG